MTSFFGQGVVGEWALIRVGCLLNILACSAGAYALNEINKVVSKTLRRFDRLQLQSIVPIAFSLQHVRHKRLQALSLFTYEILTFYSYNAIQY